MGRGTCGNVLSILAYLGWDAFPIARLNSDSASQRVKADMKRWGVKLDFASCPPTTHTPIIIQPPMSFSSIDFRGQR
jgi:sugar/nucleoside kinase (ribokinase family)